MLRTVDFKENYRPITKVDTDRYKICWNYTPLKDPVMTSNENGEAEPTGEYVDSKYAAWIYEYISSSDLDYIKHIILNWYNEQIDSQILSGFVWKDIPVWLSSENQFNYKAAYDLAVQTQGASLPITFKFGTTTKPVYYTFENLEDFNNFYIASISYINNTLKNGWNLKDSIDWSNYEID